MSSPMMTRMFGFCCWAESGVTNVVAAATDARKLKHARRKMFIGVPLVLLPLFARYRSADLWVASFLAGR